MNPHADEHFPVSVVLSRRWREHGQWRFPHWDIVAVMAEHRVPVSHPVEPTFHREAQEDGSEHFIWTGLWLELFRDSLQAYYQNLTAQQPTLVVLCRDDHEETGVAPVAVSANFADAEAHMETDGVVLATLMDAPFSKWLAEYVLKHQDYLNQQMQEHKKGKKGKKRHV